ncbi:MAG: ATP-binding protein [Thermovirgaceae bacterium]|nr:ATP-binding protein [Thermovirgaceae bacterium]
MNRSWSLATRLTLGFVLVAVTLSFTVVAVLEFLVNHQFSAYMEENRLKKHDEIVNYFEQVYAKNSSWSEDSGTEISDQAMRDGNVVTLLDGKRKVLWAMDREMVAIHYRMMGHPNTEYEEREYPVLSGGTAVGSVRVGYFSGMILLPEDTAFRDSIREGILVSSLLGVIAAICFSVILSRKLSLPLRRTKELADRIQKGDLSVRITDNFGTKELDSLASGLNFLAQSLQNQEELRKQLTRDISHELRTPLNALNALIEAYIDGIMEPTPENLAGCKEEVLRLATLTRDLECLSDLEGESLSLDPELLDLGDFLRSAARTFSPLCARKGLDLAILVEEDLFLKADGDKLRQVLLNLLSNAVEYTPSGGYIRVEGCRFGDGIRIAVADSGIGIEKKELSHIFERFYRVDKSRSRNSGGTGIGLAIVEKIVKAHGWNIFVESRPGKGSRFIVDTPGDFSHCQAKDRC